MGKLNQAIRVEGGVLEALPGTVFRVRLAQSGRELLAHLAGRLRVNHIRVIPGDQVVVELPDEQSERGRIVYRK